MATRHLAVTALLMLSASCSQWDREVNIPFVAAWHGETLQCSRTAPALSDLRFYVNNVQLVDSDGRAHDVRYATEFAWENDAVALIDLENGSESCANGTPETHNNIVGAIPAGDYRGLRFTVGVPFRLNHLNPLTSAPPLDDPHMHWHWRSGYKFLRAGIRTETDGFWIHVGSTGCEGTVGNITGCRYPNRIQVDLPEFVPGEHGVQVDLARLLTGTDLDDGKPTDCSSGPAEASCKGPFAALGIDFETGEQTGAQSVFSVQ